VIQFGAIILSFIKSSLSRLDEVSAFGYAEIPATSHPRGRLAWELS
jgi:hypothetical protein